MSRHLRTLASATLVAALTAAPILGDDPSEGARALLGQVGTAYPVASPFGVADPAYPRAEQALLGRWVGRGSDTVATALEIGGASGISGERALLGR